MFEKTENAEIWNMCWKCCIGLSVFYGCIQAQTMGGGVQNYIIALIGCGIMGFIASLFLYVFCWALVSFAHYHTHANLDVIEHQIKTNPQIKSILAAAKLAGKQ